ncbi:MAG: cytochrome P450, partial [Actinobacteria bacterium]|nr:cytochrome P450 [Actinomycetota bacterium]
MDTSSGRLPDYDPLSAAQRADPYGFYARARAEAPVLYSERLGFWLVTRYEDVLGILRNPSDFSSRGALVSSTADEAPEVLAILAEGTPEMPIITDTDPPLHDRLRGLVNRAFTPRRVAELEPLVVETATELIDGVAAAGRADLVERFAWPLPLRVVGGMMRLPPADLETLHRWGNDWLALQQPGHDLERRCELARSVVAMQRYFADVLAERRRFPGDDLVSALVEAADALDEPLPEAAVLGLPFDLVVAGHVTVTRAIGNAVLFLLESPEVAARVATGGDGVARVVEEILRLESPAQGLFRTVVRDVEVGGVPIPAGAKVMVHFGSANRDDVFADAERFDPDRADLTQHLAFGKGLHFCIGAPLARLQLRVALPMLLARLRGLALDPERPPVREQIFFARG